MQNDILLFYFIYFLFYFYTSLPHAQLKQQLMIFWRELLILKEKASLLPIIFAPSGRMIRRQGGTRTSPSLTVPINLIKCQIFHSSGG